MQKDDHSQPDLASANQAYYEVSKNGSHNKYYCKSTVCKRIGDKKSFGRHVIISPQALALSPSKAPSEQRFL